MGSEMCIRDRKCAGILIEYHSEPEEALILGVGVNVCEAPENPSYSVTSLLDKGIICSAQELQDAIIREFQALKDEYDQYGAEKIQQRWSKAAHPIGALLNIRTVNEEFCGEYLGLSNNGTLQVKLDTGEVREVMAADCFMIPKG